MTTLRMLHVVRSKMSVNRKTGEMWGWSGEGQGIKAWRPWTAWFAMTRSAVAVQCLFWGCWGRSVWLIGLSLWRWRNPRSSAGVLTDKSLIWILGDLNGEPYGFGTGSLELELAAAYQYRKFAGLFLELCWLCSWILLKDSIGLSDMKETLWNWSDCSNMLWNVLRFLSDSLNLWTHSTSITLFSKCSSIWGEEYVSKLVLWQIPS